MTTEQAQRVVSQAISLGMTLQWNLIQPGADRVKQREAWRYLERQGFSRGDLEDWVRLGYVKRRKDERKGANSAVWYSLIELQKRIIAIRMAEID